MFLDLPMQYTSPVVNKNRTVVVEKFMKKGKNVFDYTSKTINCDFILTATYTKTIKIKPNRIPTEHGLKKAMFRMSSKGLSNVLNK